MRIVAYLYRDPLLEAVAEPIPWGWEIAQVYQDLASGDGLAPDRPQWQALLQDAQTQPPDHVLVRRLEDLGDSVQAVGDRLTQLAALQLPRSQRPPPPAWGEGPGTGPRGGPPPLAQTELIHVLQHLHREQQRQKIRQGHARNRIQATPPPGKAPYGYKRGKDKYSLDRTTAPVVKDFFEQFLLYGSVRGAVRYLAKKYNKIIAVSTGHRWLLNPVYRGDLAYQTGDTIRDTHAAIITRDEAAQVDRLLRRNRRMSPRSASAPRSLAGLVLCQQCQSPQTVAPVAGAKPGQDYLYLRPNACPRSPKCRAIPYADVLQSTITRICEDLPRAIAALSLPDVNGIKQGLDGAIAAKQGILDQLPNLVTTGTLDQETADLRTYKLKTEIATLQNQRAQLPPVNLQSVAQAVSIPQFWLDLSESERRFYFREFLQKIELVRAASTPAAPASTAPANAEPAIAHPPWHLHLVFIF